MARSPPPPPPPPPTPCPPHPPHGPRPSSHRLMHLRSSATLVSRDPRSRRSTISTPSPRHTLTPPRTFLRSCCRRCQEALTIACRREGDRRIPVNASSVDFVFVGRALDAAKLLADLASRPRGSSSPTVIPPHRNDADIWLHAG
jgi:hypothetical protein